MRTEIDLKEWGHFLKVNLDRSNLDFLGGVYMEEGQSSW